MEKRLIIIRKLVALDIFLHGRPFILAEFGLATPILLAFGLQQIVSGLSTEYLPSLILGFYLMLTGVNYAALLAYAILISSKNSAESEAEAQLEHKSRYNTQQFLIFIPLLVFLIAVKQEIDKGKPP